MARRRKEIVMPHLNDCGGDLTKKWYVEYSVRNPKTDKMERLRHYEDINVYSTCDERYACAKKIIRKYAEQIQSGDIAFRKFVEYEDMLLYDGQGSFTRKRMSPPGNLRIYLSEFLQQKKSEINETSLHTYTSELRLFGLYAEEKKVLNKPATYFTSDFIADFLRDLASKKNLSRLTVSKYEQLLHSFFAFLKTKKIVTDNPVTDIPRIGAIKDEAPAAIPSYMRKLLQEVIEPADPQLWLFICFQYYAAIRPGIELRLMRLNQINYDSRTIIIPNHTSKNNRSETVDIPDQLYDLIVNRFKLNTYNQELYVFGRYGVPGEICLGKNNMKNRFTAFRRNLKLPDSVKLYSWKHSGAQELADSGTSIYELQRHLRHRDITTTEMYLKKRIGQRSGAIRHKFPSI